MSETRNTDNIVVGVKPVLDVGNVWCGSCGHKEFYLGYRMLTCINCGSNLEWADTWKEWYVSSSPGQPTEPTQPPNGTKWHQATDYWTMIQQFNPNTGKKLADPEVIKELENWKATLTRKMLEVDHKLKQEFSKGR